MRFNVGNLNIHFMRNSEIVKGKRIMKKTGCRSNTNVRIRRKKESERVLKRLKRC